MNLSKFWVDILIKLFLDFFQNMQKRKMIAACDIWYALKEVYITSYLYPAFLISLKKKTKNNKLRF